MARRTTVADGRLTTRARSPAHRIAARAGVRALGLDDRDALVRGPTGESGAPVPLIVSLHGAGGDARGGLILFAAAVQDLDMVVLAPQSHGRTWDLISEGQFGPDAAFLDRALALVFDSYDIDRSRVALAGFSDGASYALGLGLQNGDLFTHLIALSPGFAPGVPGVGRPRIFVSHGTSDPVLPIDRCSRQLVPQLERAGHSVRYEEFDGGHVVPVWLSSEAVDWLREGREPRLGPPART